MGSHLVIRNGAACSSGELHEVLLDRAWTPLEVHLERRYYIPSLLGLHAQVAVDLLGHLGLEIEIILGSTEIMGI